MAATPHRRRSLQLRRRAIACARRPGLLRLQAAALGLVLPPVRVAASFAAVAHGAAAAAAAQATRGAAAGGGADAGGGSACQGGGRGQLIGGGWGRLLSLGVGKADKVQRSASKSLHVFTAAGLMQAP